MPLKALRSMPWKTDLPIIRVALTSNATTIAPRPMKSEWTKFKSP